MQQEITPEVLWEKTKDQDGQHDTWYKKAVSYWDQQEASYDGVLGGFGHVSDIDIRDSKQVLLKVRTARRACPQIYIPFLSRRERQRWQLRSRTP